MKVLSLIATSLILTGFAGLTSVANARTATGNTTYRAPSAYSGSSYMNEFSTIVTRGGYQSEKLCKDCDTGTALDISGSYLRTLPNNLQAGGEARLQSLSKEYSGTGKSISRIDLIGEGVFNFDSNFQNAFYAKAGIGFYSVLKSDRSDYENKLGLFIGAGKRFPLFASVAYSPELRLIKRGDIDFGIEIDLISFSISW